MYRNLTHETIRMPFEAIDGLSTINVEIPHNYQKKPVDWFDKWMSALESGKYKKGIGQLVENVSTDMAEISTYCCLGVLSSALCRLDQNADIDPETRDVSETYIADGRLHDELGGGSVIFRLSGIHIDIYRHGKKQEIDNIGGLNDNAMTFAPVIRVLRLIFCQA